MLAEALAMSAASRTALSSSSRSTTARVVWPLRQDLLVVRELAVDQAADQVDPLEVEEDLVAGRGEHDLDRVVGVVEDPLSSFSDRAGTTRLVSSTGSRIGSVLTAIR